MVYVTGDTHGFLDVNKLTTMKFKEQKDISKDDYLIVCGDFGAIWNGGDTDKYTINWYEKKPWTTLFIDGNHENFDLLNDYSVENWKGGKVQKISDTIYHLMRGEVYDICGKKFFTIGGAESIDKDFRIEGASWWPRERISTKDIINAAKTLMDNDFKVDYVISHCAPTSFLPKIAGYLKPDESTKALDKIYEVLDYDKWFFGHYHKDLENEQYKFRAIYDDVIRVI